MGIHSIAALVEEQHGALPKDALYVWAESYAESLFEKMKEQLGKTYYVLFLEQGKLHIYTIAPWKQTKQVTKEVIQPIENLQNISISNIGSQTKPQAKVISFLAPSGEKHRYYIPYESREFQHKEQDNHLIQLVEALMPTE